MNQSADAADQVVRMSLNGTEVALRIAGKGSKEAAILLIKAIRSAHKQTNKTKGAIRLNNLIRSGRKLDIARIADSDVKQFCSEAKKYGILYTVLKNRTSKDGVTEIMFKSDDREKFNMIFSKLGKSPSYLAEVKEEIEAEINDKAKNEVPTRTTSDADKFVDDLMKKPDEKTVSEKEGVHKADPPKARTTQSSRSEPSSDTPNRAEAESSPGLEHPSATRKSVRKELDEIKAEMAAEKSKNKARQKTPAITHKNPGKKKNKKRNRER